MNQGNTVDNRIAVRLVRLLFVPVSYTHLTLPTKA
jgi:hypothetical protein